MRPLQCRFACQEAHPSTAQRKTCCSAQDASGQGGKLFFYEPLALSIARRSGWLLNHACCSEVKRLKASQRSFDVSALSAAHIVL